VSKAASRLRPGAAQGSDCCWCRSATARTAAPREWRRFIPPANGFTIDERATRGRAGRHRRPAGRVRLKPSDARFLPMDTGRRSPRGAAGPGHRREATRGVLERRPLRQVPMEHYAGSRGFVCRRASGPGAPARQRLTSRERALRRERAVRDAPRDEHSVLPREYVVELPDLALLQSALYPSACEPTSPSRHRRAPGRGVDAGVVRARDSHRRLVQRNGSSSASRRTRRPWRRGPDVILLERATTPVRCPADLTRLPRGTSWGRLPFLQEVESPRGDGRTCSGSAPGRRRFSAWRHAAWVRRPYGRGSAETRVPGREVHSFPLGPRRTIAEISYLTRLGAWLREHWLALPLILAATSGSSSPGSGSPRALSRAPSPERP